MKCINMYRRIIFVCVDDIAPTLGSIDRHYRYQIDDNISLNIE